MKPNEVRFVNLVKYKGKVYKIAAITEEYPYLNTTEFGDGVVEWGDLEGIELNEEWLIKFGFKKVKDISISAKSFHYENGKCWIYLIENGFEFELITLSERHNSCKTYKYVHQLQNLYFALTDRELILNL